RQFLVEEAELSEDEEGAAVSSDEEDGADLDGSLEGFVVDNTHLSQGLNSEMQGVYLKSVRSPAVRGKFRMSYKARPDVDVFSQCQVPELDETYAEDSFVVGSDEEEPESHEEEPEEVELLPEASYVDGRRQYATRRRVFLHRARAGTRTETGTRSADEQRARSKRSRLLRLNDSSEEEEVSRPFQRTRYYYSTLAALVDAGIRLLWSDGAEQSAALLADLAKLEHRKGQGVAVPLEVKGQRRQQALQVYLSLPSVSHVHALNLLHNFSSIGQLIDSVEGIQRGGCMSRTRAEGIYRFLRYSCDP
uniref:FANCM n=1 Tax=Fundulus heteroclitus TaxID=8078 RepID=A0A3Q2P075_FUNHE